MTAVRPSISKQLALGLLAATVGAAIFLVTRPPGGTAGPADEPLAAPEEPETVTTPPPARPVAPSDGWRLAIQTPGVLWQIDIDTGEIHRLVEPAGDSLPRGGDIVVLRTGGMDLSEGGSPIEDGADVVLIERDGDELAFGAGLPAQRSLPQITQNPQFALTPRPIALVPSRSDGVEVLRRVALDGSVLDDVPLPGCGQAIPLAATGTDRVFATWCRDSDDLRLFHDGTAGLVETRIGEIRADGLTPALLPRGDKPILIDPFGGVWELIFSESLFDDPERLIGGDARAIRLRDDERILGIAAITNDFERVVVGASSGSDLDGSVTASRLVGHDTLGFGDGWSRQPPVPIVSLVGAPDGRIYALGSADGAGVLIAIDPPTGSMSVLHVDLPIREGRLMVLP